MKKLYLRETEKSGGKALTLALTLLTVVLSVVVWLNFGPLVSLLLGKLPLFSTPRFAPSGDYLLVHVPFLLLFLSLLFGILFLVKAPFLGYLTNREHFSFSLLGTSFALYLFFLLLLQLPLLGTLQPGDAVPGSRLPLFLLTLCLTPIQALSEELLFRVIPFRAFHLVKEECDRIDTAVLILLSGLLFLAPHIANAEMHLNGSVASAMLYYFLYGALAMGISIASEGFEVSIAMHSANNLFIALFVGYPGASIPSEPLCMRISAAGPAELIIELLSLFAVEFFFITQSKKAGLFPIQRK